MFFLKSYENDSAKFGSTPDLKLKSTAMFHYPNNNRCGCHFTMTAIKAKDPSNRAITYATVNIKLCRKWLEFKMAKESKDPKENKRLHYAVKTQRLLLAPGINKKPSLS